MKEKDMVGDFWKKYYTTDCLKRQEMIEKTKCFERVFELMTTKKLSKKIKKFTFIQYLQSYFDDLINVMEK